MRIEGTLAKWNDDRGFGFIASTQGGAEVFVHISAFPRDGQRPKLGERLTFQIQTGTDGRKSATNLICLDRPKRRSAPRPATFSRRERPRLLGRIAPVMIIALAIYGYGRVFPARYSANGGRTALKQSRTSIFLSLRWSYPLLTDDFLRGGNVLHPAVPQYSDGW
jgi:cold shock CspA family protein